MIDISTKKLRNGRCLLLLLLCKIGNDFPKPVRAFEIVSCKRQIIFLPGLMKSIVPKKIVVVQYNIIITLCTYPTIYIYIFHSESWV